MGKSEARNLSTFPNVLEKVVNLWNLLPEKLAQIF